MRNSYYIYYNWRAKPDIGTIHISYCGNCKDGNGKHPNAHQGKNGIWSAAHKNLNDAENEVRKKDFDIAYCRCINSKKQPG